MLRRVLAVIVLAVLVTACATPTEPTTVSKQWEECVVQRGDSLVFTACP